MTDLAEMLTVEDVARISGFSAYTVRAAIRDGELVASKPRGRYRVHPDNVAAWMDDTTVHGAGVGDDARHRPIVRPKPSPPSGSARDAIRAIRSKAA